MWYMAKRSVATKKTLVDPIFALPPGSEDEFVYTRNITDDDVFLDEEFNDVSDITFDDGSDDLNGVELEVPEDFTIVSQAIRYAPGGQQVVDVVIEVEDIEGAIEYEIQVVKV